MKLFVSTLAVLSVLVGPSYCGSSGSPESSDEALCGPSSPQRPGIVSLTKEQLQDLEDLGVDSTLPAPSGWQGRSIEDISDLMLTSQEIPLQVTFGYCCTAINWLSNPALDTVQIKDAVDRVCDVLILCRRDFSSRMLLNGPVGRSLKRHLRTAALTCFHSGDPAHKFTLNSLINLQELVNGRIDKRIHKKFLIHWTRDFTQLLIVAEVQDLNLVGKAFKGLWFSKELLAPDDMVDWDRRVGLFLEQSNDVFNPDGMCEAFKNYLLYAGSTSGVLFGHFRTALQRYLEYDQLSLRSLNEVMAGYVRVRVQPDEELYQNWRRHLLNQLVCERGYGEKKVEALESILNALATLNIQIDSELYIKLTRALAESLRGSEWRAGRLKEILFRITVSHSRLKVKMQNLLR